jgi:hypothetical protein
MTEYGKGGVLGTAVALPATSAAGLYLLDATQPFLIAGFIGISFISSVLLAGYIIRFKANSRNA